ncbi:AraC family transcriptional regulator [Azospirillum sp. SYSU D00513]|uniref:AraC family transcriptional regulator n=1 Tax=Azospirillum sp. SYSU D00513 TaxID=2812561 RepID=UPI001A964C40|nr:AraC family transcriptional regulator [Azospirillum sp. SYSU D00513]
MADERARVSLRSYDGRETLHAHGFHQVVLPVAGCLEMQVGAVGGCVAAGRGVLVAGGVEHSFRAAGDNRFVVLDLPDGGDALLRSAAARPFFAMDGALDSLAGYLAFEAGAAPLDAAAAHHAVHLLRRSLERRLALPERTEPAGPVGAALAIMRARLDEPLRVEELARAAGLAPSRFHELFRLETGESPARRLAELRLDRAEELLRDGRLPIAEVALATGFSDQSALTRSLRRARGTTPAALRRRAAMRRD